MRIRVQLHGELRRKTLDSLELEIDEGATVADVIEVLGFRSGEVWLAMAGGQLIQPDHRLPPGVELALLPPVGGGA